MISQLTVFLANEKGRLAAACRTLADADINMKALFIADTADFGIVRIFCDTPKRPLARWRCWGRRASAPRSRRSSPCPSRMLPALWPIFSDSAKGPR